MVATKVRRAAGAVIGAAAVTMAAAACSSDSGGSPSPSASAGQAGQRVSSVDALLTQCAITRDIGGVAGPAARASDQLPAAEQWLHQGQLTLTKANGSQFNAWYQGHLAGVVSHGSRIDDWGVRAAASGKLPTEICGAGLTAKSLYQQIYAKYPSRLKNDPWPS
jgi:hypothetical protein